MIASADPVSILYTGVHVAILGGLYGLLVGVLWTPFLLTDCFRTLFESFPRADWRVNYALTVPIPGAVWGFFFGGVLSLSLDVRPPTEASEIYVAGVDGLVIATLVSVVLWPVLLLYVLPARGFDWNRSQSFRKTAVLVVLATVWYLVFLAGPAYVLSIFAGFGDAMSGT